MSIVAFVSGDNIPELNILRYANNRYEPKHNPAH